MHLSKSAERDRLLTMGGAGGILVAIDKESGALSSDGCDENGVRYDSHPENGSYFNGYQLPEWNKACELARIIGSKVPGAKYIGWDLAHSKKNGWVVIEGNAYTQFIGQQCTTLKGKRSELYRALNLDNTTYKL